MDEFHSVYLNSKRQRQAAEFHRYRVQHDLHKIEFCGSMIVAPISKEKPIRILDSATGEGIWIIEEAERYPKAIFVGTDIEPAGFDEHKNLPDRISFRQQSVLDKWPDADKSAYDLVHQRYGFTNVPADKCLDVVKSLLELVKPSGYLQLVDTDLMGFEQGEGHEGMAEMVRFMRRFFAQGGFDPSSGHKIESWVKAAGAEDVEVQAMSFGVGKRAKTEALADLSAWNILTLIDNFSFVCEKIPGFWYTPEQFKQLAVAVKKELDTVGNTWKFWVVIGRRAVKE